MTLLMPGWNVSGKEGRMLQFGRGETALMSAVDFIRSDSEGFPFFMHGDKDLSAFCPAKQ
jgi:hypothetical protein